MDVLGQMREHPLVIGRVERVASLHQSFGQPRVAGSLGAVRRSRVAQDPFRRRQLPPGRVTGHRVWLEHGRRECAQSPR